METILVTGGAGFIGSHVCRHLLDKNRKVIVLDDLSGGNKANLPAGIEFTEGSINDASLIKALFKEHNFDYVFHLAAYAAESRSHYLRRFNYQNNVMGSVNLINAAIEHGVKCFVFTSSIAVYGEQAPPVVETSHPKPIDPYGIAKYAVEMDLQAAKKQFGLDYIIFRPHNVYGPNQNIHDPDRNVIGIFMKQLMSGQAMSIIGDGQQSRAFSFIDDVAATIAKSIDVPSARNEVFNLGADKEYTINALAEEVARAMKIEPAVKHLAARKEVRHAYASHEKVNNTFGLDSNKQTSLESGLEQMAAWAKQQVLSETSSSLINEIPND